MTVVTFSPHPDPRQGPLEVLFLDDETYRHDWIRDHSDGCSITHVSTAERAITLLGRTRFDVVSLDHDLGNDAAGNGMQVAEAIAAMEPGKRPGLVVVHSFNAPASTKMRVVLEMADVPTVRAIFSTFTFTGQGVLMRGSGGVL